MSDIADLVDHIAELIAMRVAELLTPPPPPTPTYGELAATALETWDKINAPLPPELADAKENVAQDE